ncbi:DUF4388 domain-containing protein [Coleofasciculus chthonoplastes]|uniref:DUF4388 domain-containing protein n=1 Tax=Coleofasciculus chthonoplastes TaxID=64178 RepID=UPI0032F29D34
MSITSSLSDFSIPEIFQFLEKGQKTGVLTLGALPEYPTPLNAIYYIWVYQGRIVAAAHQLDHQGLVKLIAEQMGVSQRVVTKLVQLCPTDKPLGLSLKHHGILSIEHLKQLFQNQVLQRVCTLFELKEGQFKFIPNAPIPTKEMTGLSISATEATLRGLRLLKNWDNLHDKLPDPNSGLASIMAGSPAYRLYPLEEQVWERAQGTVSLSAIAKELNVPVEQVQHVAFTLMTVGLVEEVPLLAGILPTQEIEPLQAQLSKASEKQGITPSLLQNLVGFLRSKGGNRQERNRNYISTHSSPTSLPFLKREKETIQC